MAYGLFPSEDEATPIPVEYRFIHKNSQLKEQLNDIFDMDTAIGLDTETNGLDPFSNNVLMLQLSDGYETFVIDTRSTNTDPLKEYLESNEIVKICHNAPFDYSMVKNSLGINLQNIYCSLVAEQVISAGFQERFRLKDVALKRLGVVLEKDPALSFLKIGNAPFSEIQKVYGARDAFILPEIRNQQLMDAESLDILPVINLEMDCVIPVTEMQLRGCILNVDRWRLILEYAHIFENIAAKELKTILADVDSQPTLFGYSSVNLNSQQQLLTMLKRFGIDIESTSSKEMSQYKGQHRAIDLLLEYRMYEKIRAAYGEELLKKINSVTGRLHPRYNQARAETGRMSSSGPNAQNIPGPKDFHKKLVEIQEVPECCKEFFEPGYEAKLPKYSTDSKEDEDGNKLKDSDKYVLMGSDKERYYYIDRSETMYIYVYDFRECFVPKKGYKLVQCDMPKAEICIMADASGDRILIDAINNGEDVYKRAAAESTGTPYADVDDSLRKTYKAVVLGLAYGLSVFGLARNLNIPEKHAEEVIDNFKNAFKVLNKFLDEEGRRCLLRGYAITAMKRKRHFPFNIDPNEDPVGADILKNSIERRGKNHPMQGGNADLTKLALSMIHKEFIKRKLDCGLQIVVHDEFVAEAREDIVDEVGQIMADCIEKAFAKLYPSVVVKADYNVGDYWMK